MDETGKRGLSTHTSAGNVAAAQGGGVRPRANLFLVSFLVLFLELACIRWFPAHVLYLTFFTNTVLMACFLGMSVGCLAASRTRNYLMSTPLLLLLALTFGHLVELSRRIRVRDGIERGRELEEVLELAAQFPARHRRTISFPKITRR